MILIASLTTSLRSSKTEKAKDIIVMRDEAESVKLGLEKVRKEMVGCGKIKLLPRAK